MEKTDGIVGKVLLSQIKEVVYKYCPYTDDRYELLDGDESPIFGIDIWFNKNSTYLYFLFGKKNAKNQVPEEIEIDHIMTIEEIEELVNFIQEDHKHLVVNRRDVNNNSTKFKFAIDWASNGSFKGIKCNMMELILNFRDNPELEKKYLYVLNEEVFGSKDTSSRWDYFGSVMSEYIDSADKATLIELLNKLNSEELKQLMKSNIKQLFEVAKEEPKVKELLMGKSEK